VGAAVRSLEERLLETSPTRAFIGDTVLNIA
jgi:hypothetical protein